MGRTEDVELAALLEEERRRARINRIETYFPETGPLRRELYPKHMAFFAAGATFRERCFMAGNRVGKTETGGGYEMVMHMTGKYPKWWVGKRFNRPVQAWGAGNSGKTVREIIQSKLLGPANAHGTGLIPGDLLLRTTPKQGIPEAVDTIYVRHVSGGVSQLGLKSYDQKRTAFEGTKQDVIWLDEESPLDIYTECLLRTMDTSGTGDENGIVMLTFTPMMGLSETVMAFLPNGELTEKANGSKCVIMASWDDAPHLTDQAKADLLASIPPFQRDARSKGIPQLGAGAIYPVPESEFVVDDMPIPDHWPRAYGMDVGWNRTAAAFAAWDRESDIVYLYSEHYRGQAEPAVHAESILARGNWIPGVMDPAARGRSQVDGQKLMDIYGKSGLGLDIEKSSNAVEAGIYDLWTRLSTGRLKVFRSMGSWLQEFRLYRRDEKGHVVKSNDHLMDATRYLILSGLARAKTKPIKNDKQYLHSIPGGSESWMA